MAVIDPRFAVSSSPMGAVTILRAVNAIEQGVEACIRALRLAEARRRTGNEIGRLSARQMDDIGLSADTMGATIERRIR